VWPASRPAQRARRRAGSTGSSFAAAQAWQIGEYLGSGHLGWPDVAGHRCRRRVNLVLWLSDVWLPDRFMARSSVRPSMPAAHACTAVVMRCPPSAKFHI